MERTAWALQWRSENRLDGLDEHLIVGPAHDLKLFRTRDEARDYKREHYGYISRRQDLRSEPHGWKVPKVLRVRVVVEPLSGGPE